MAQDMNPDVLEILNILSRVSNATTIDSPATAAGPLAATRVADPAAAASTLLTGLSAAGATPRAESPAEGYLMAAIAATASRDPPATARSVLVAPPTSAPDPSAIKTYAAALRYITGTLLQDKRVMDRIKKMRQHQQDHEKQWFEGREGVKRKYEQRRKGRKTLEGVLKLVGGNTDKAEEELQRQDSLDETEELARYDLKVHAASVQMVKAMSAELASLGVPLFCNPDYMAAEKNAESKAGAVDGDLAEMLENKRKIVELLDDLCDED
ncbi:uncharacterized protein V1510DRAFT_421592 [Dipodascopsis tothii]|uniref:uncharacterized protein n=1 Tax=Dipodascopsis tothii TaxID=44089 RepID=UPI0034D00B33